MHLLDTFFDKINQVYFNSAGRGFNIRLFTFFILAVGLTNHSACNPLIYNEPGYNLKDGGSNLLPATNFIKTMG